MHSGLKRALKRALLAIVFLPLLGGPAWCVEVYALGSSATTCAGVDRDKIYPVRLQERLRRDGFDVTVFNGGVDGNRPAWMLKRLRRRSRRTRGS